MVSNNGFLTEIVKSFQSYVNSLHQNQATLIEGYDQEILTVLTKAKEFKFQSELAQKVEFVDEKIENCK